MKGAGRSIRGIAGEPGIAWNMVRRYLNTPEVIGPKSRPRRASKLDPHAEYVDRRMSEGVPSAGKRRLRDITGADRPERVEVEPRLEGTTDDF